MRHQSYFTITLWVAVLALLFGTALFAGQIDAYSLTGIYDVDGITYLQGNTTSGDLVQLILAGGNGQIDEPDTLGNVTGDDVLLGTSHIGYGFPFNPNEGKFSTTFTNDLLVSGAVVYVRAWNVAAVTSSNDAYGDSELYTLNSDFEENDFGTWSCVDLNSTPVEMTSFKVSTKSGVTVLEWTTQTETDNLGFYVYRSKYKTGKRERLNSKIIPGAINSEVRHDYEFADRKIESQTEYYYWIADISVNGSAIFHGPQKIVTAAKPDQYKLDQNFPNPFNPTTTIQYALKDDGFVSLQIFNIRGQLVRNLVNSNQFSGEHAIMWDGMSDNGMHVASGIYFFRIKVNDYVETRKMSLMK